MSKQSLFIIFIIFGISSSFAQDKITRTNGNIVKCQILSVDSSKITFRIEKYGTRVNTHLTMDQIESYTFQGTVHQIVADSGQVMNHLHNKENRSILLADSIENLNKYFIYTYSNEILFGKEIIYENPLLRAPYFLVDSVRFEPETVKFYKNEMGFFANVKTINFSGSSDFSERIKKGKINLYETETRNYMPAHYNSSTGIMTPGIRTKHIMNYYNIGFGDIKKTKYKNLKHDLIDNPNSIFYLNKYKTMNNTKNTLLVIGGVSLIGGIVSILNKDMSDQEQNFNATGSIVAIGIGTGCFWASYIISLSKPKHLRKAVEVYNN